MKLTNTLQLIKLKMEFSRKEDSTSPKKIIDKTYLIEKYPLDLNMYLEVPTEQIHIEEFQEMAVERVKLLRILETASLKSVKGLSFKDIVIDEMTKQNMKYFISLVRGYADAETRRRDHISHYILRLCYCRSEDYRRWFLARELEFFRLKFFNMEKKEDILLFMKRNNLSYTPITDEEKLCIATDLFNSTSKNINLDVTNIYKVPFTQVLDLVRVRKVFIKLGNAYVPHLDLISILISLFRVKLSHSLAICAANISKLESDERLSRVLKGLHTSYTGNDYCMTSNEQISRNNLDTLSVKSYPLCMRFMHETFKTNHHLRHQARLQYGLFLKGIGVSLEESLKFWREGFTKKHDIDVDSFEKKYSYSIRHSYGTEGKRAKYTPHSCMKILNTNVAPGDNHGCPFKHYDVNTLKQKLLSYNLSVIDVTNIADYVMRGHYQLACTRYFEITHSVSNAKGINHPNLYFEESQNIITGKYNDDKKKLDNSRRKEPGTKISEEWEISENSFDLNMSNIC